MAQNSSIDASDTEEDKNTYLNNLLDQLIEGLHGVGKLLNQPFFIMSSNVQCVTSDNKYIPLELSFVKFTIENGITEDCYTEFVNPGKVPFGLHSAALDHQKIHKIPPTGLGRLDYDAVMQEIVDYLQDSCIKPEVCNINCPDLLVLSLPEQTRQNNGVLDWFRDQFSQIPFNIEVLDLSLFLFNVVSKKSPDFSFAQSMDILQGTYFDYSPGNCCEFHEEDDNETKFCAQAIAKCYFFNMAEHFCKIFDIHHGPSFKPGTIQLPEPGILEANEFNQKNSSTRPIEKNSGRNVQRPLQGTQRTTSGFGRGRGIVRQSH